MLTVYYNNSPKKVKRDDIEYKKLFRKDGPSIILTNGTEEWWTYGKRHRENGLPAIKKSNGTREWFLSGRRHRENDLPAIMKSNGLHEWFTNGSPYREDGRPNKIYVDKGLEKWFREEFIISRYYDSYYKEVEFNPSKESLEKYRKRKNIIVILQKLIKFHFVLNMYSPLYHPDCFIGKYIKMELFNLFI